MINMGMSDESIRWLLDKILHEAIDVVPQSEPKECWEDRNYNHKLIKRKRMLKKKPDEFNDKTITDDTFNDYHGRILGDKRKSWNYGV